MRSAGFKPAGLRLCRAYGAERRTDPEVYVPVRAVFFIAGPTATGKSEIAADVAGLLDAEIVSADAFQIYRGFDLLTAKPDARTLARVPHHLIGAVSIQDQMNAERFRQMACGAIDEIHSRGKLAVVVGGSGLYIKALTHGLILVPASDRTLRAQLNELSLDQLRARLINLDPKMARKIDMNNRRRLVRAIEICLITGKAISTQRGQWKSSAGVDAPGVFVFRDRDELYERINHRVRAMFEHGVIEEVREIGAVSETASGMIGLREIRKLLEEEIGGSNARSESIKQCIEQIQRATRRYAKRQLTWFRHQTSFTPLNLSLLTHNEAVKWISQLAKCSEFAQLND